MKLKSIKKFFAATLALLMLFGAASCTGETPDAAKKLAQDRNEGSQGVEEIRDGEANNSESESSGAATNAETPQTDPLTREQVLGTLLATAEKYRDSLTPETITQGIPESGDTVTRAEALAMISNAFGKFPAPKGDAVRRAAGVAEYTDTPDWAGPAIDNLNSGLLLVPAEDNLLKPNEAITEKELDTYLRRVWALYGTRLEDDFYAYVNKEWLDTAEIPEGKDRVGSMWDVVNQSAAQVDAILDEILNGKWEKGTVERKIVDYYNAFIDIDAQNKVGAEPLKPYLDKLAEVKNAADLNAALASVASGTAYFPYVKLWLGQDHMNGRKYAVYLSAEFTTSMSEEFTEYAINALTAAGVKNPAETAKLAAGMQSRLVEACKNLPDISALNIYEEMLTNKLVPASDAAKLIPNADMGAILDATGLKPEEKYYVTDYGEAKLKALATLYTDENAPALAALAQYMLIEEWKWDMGDLFAEPGAPNRTPAELVAPAREMVLVAFQDFLAPIYMERHIPKESKAELTKMAHEMVGAYKGSIQKLDWMGEATKAMAIKKLDAMALQMAYPDKYGIFADIIEIRGPGEGGSYLENRIATLKAIMRENADSQGKPKETLVSMDTFYSAAANANNNQNGVTVCAGLLLPPVYDPGASMEEKMASIGWVVAHEITHNFDPSGSRYDENGGLADWWAEGDKAKFDELCGAVSDYYAGMEYAPGLVREAGQTSIDENTADLGGIACALEALKNMKPDPDYELFFKSAAVLWRESLTREGHEIMREYDSHSAGTNRTNLVLKTLPEFYEAFDIKPGDGMYLAPEKRVKVW